VAGSRAHLPDEAEAVAGRVLNSLGEDLCSPMSEGKVVNPVALQVDGLGPDDLCPVVAMTVAPEAANHHWYPLKPSPLDQGCCGLRVLLGMGPITIGSLKPFATAVYVSGRTLSEPLEDCPTTGELATHVKQVMGLDIDGTFSFADESNLEEALPPDTVIRIGQRMRALAKLQVVVTFGKTDLGLDGATVAVEGWSPSFAKTTSSSGRCELLLPGGLHQLSATHPVLGGAMHAQVDVRKLRGVHHFAASTQVLLYILPAKADSPSDAPLTAWLAASSAQIPKDARPVAASVKVRQIPVGGEDRASYWEVVLDGDAISAINLEEDSESLGAGVRRMPASGISVTCVVDNHLWHPQSNWHLEEVSAWRELLRGPIQVGILKPCVIVRCHGFGSSHRMLYLPAEAHKKASAVCKAAAMQLEVPEACLALFREELQLDLKDAVRSFAVLDLWLMATLQVRVMTQCCITGRLLGLDGAVVRVTEDYAMDGQPTLAADARRLVKPGYKVRDAAGRPAAVTRLASRGTLCEVKYLNGSMAEVPVNTLSVQDPRQGGVTDVAGSCLVTTTAGEHTILVQHPLLRRSATQEAHSEQVESEGKRTLVWSRRIKLGKDGSTESFHVGAQFFLFEMPSEEDWDLQRMSDDDGDAAINVRRVWAAAHREDLPDGAKPLPGFLRLHRRGGDTVPAALQNVVGKPVPLPKVQNLALGEDGGPFDVTSFSVEAEGEDGLLWCPEGVGVLSKDTSLGHVLLTQGAQLLGLLKPGVRVFCEELPTGPHAPMQIPVDADTGASEVLRQVFQELRVSAREVGLFMQDGHRFAENVPIGKDMRLWARPLAPLKLRVLVPEGPVGDTTRYGLPGVTIKVDGDIAGSTDQAGFCEAHVRLGARKVQLEHFCFGPAGRNLGEIDVSANFTDSEHVVVADVRLIVSATKADEDTPDTPETLMVWIGACKDHIQGTLVEVNGIVQGKDAHGREVRKDLHESGLTELLLVRGADLEADVSSDRQPKCSLASVQVQAHCKGYRWRPREPSPLVERAAEIGGSEFLRLLACPCVFGYLDPVIEVHFKGGLREPFAVPLGDVATVGNVKDVLATALHIEEEILSVKSDGSILADSDAVHWGMQLEADEAEQVNISVVTGCCGSVIEGIAVSVDGVPAGTTDQDGQVIALAMTVGEHEVKFVHPAFGPSGEAVRIVNVERGEDNDFMVVTDVNICIYASSPDKDDEDESGVSSGADRDVEPSFVWLAADSAHIADSVSPVQGRVHCETTDGNTLTATLGPSKVSPLALRVAVDPRAHTLRRKWCLLGKLKLQCQQRGFKWSPKEPLPVAQRVEDIGGCEFLRVVACPVALGLLKPTVMVQCANGQLFTVTVEDYPDMEALRSYVAEELGAEDEEAAEMQLEVVEGRALPNGRLQPPENGGGLRCLAALPGELLSDARTALRELEAQEKADRDKVDAKADQESDEQTSRESFQAIRTDIPTLTEISTRFQPIPGL